MKDLKNETDKVIAELQWFRSVLQKGGKVAEYYEAQSDILTKAIKLLENPEWKTEGKVIINVYQHPGTNLDHNTQSR